MIYIGIILLIVGLVMLLPMFIPVMLRVVKRVSGGEAQVVPLLEELQREVEYKGVVEESAPPTLFGGVHYPDEYKDFATMAQQQLHIHNLPLLYFQDAYTYAEHKKLEKTKVCEKVVTVGKEYDEVVVYHIADENVMSALVSLIVQAKNDYIPHPSLGITDSFNIDRAFVVLMVTVQQTPALLPELAEYLSLINNLSNYRFMVVINDLSHGVTCSALHIPHKDYYIVLDATLSTSELPQNPTTQFKHIEYNKTAIHRHVVRKRKAPHLDLYVVPPHSAHSPNTLTDALLSIPESSYSKRFENCEDLYKEGIAMNEHMMFYREREKVATTKKGKVVSSRPTVLIYVLGETFSVRDTIDDLCALCADASVLVIAPPHHADSSRHALQYKNKLCVIELWCFANGVEMLGHTTDCYHTTRGGEEYCLAVKHHDDATNLAHLCFYHDATLPHLSYQLRPYHSLCYQFKD